jgi:peptidoglycan hydrolase CwlO-like protein
MSTAGKVLVVLVMLASIVCLILAGGVAQVNYNANQRLQKLSEELAKAQGDIEATRREIAETRDQTTEAQEKIDRDIATLRSQQADIERTRTQIVDTLARLQYDLSTVNATIEGARTSLTNRNAEFEAEQKATDDLRRDVQSLKATNAQLMARLGSLRDQFQKTYRSNVEMLGRGR